MLEYVLLVVFLIPVIMISFDTEKWMAKLRSLYLKYKAQQSKSKLQNSNLKSVYLDCDETGAFIEIEKERFYLKAYKTGAFKGIAIGSSFFTSDETKALKKSVVIDEDF